MEKTNVMRVLESKKIKYQAYDYSETGCTVGEEIAKMLGQNPSQVFKTLVTVGKTGKNYVFAIPVCGELDLKKAAKAVGEKSIEMIKQKELLPLTGYIHGGCSPIGMKKSFPTVFHSGINEFETIIFSAGKVGFQVQVAVSELGKVIRYETADVLITTEVEDVRE